MSKSYKKRHATETDADEWYINGERDRNIQKRKKKRLNRAIKTKDIDELLEYDDDSEVWFD